MLVAAESLSSNRTTVPVVPVSGEAPPVVIAQFTVPAEKPKILTWPDALVVTVGDG